MWHVPLGNYLLKVVQSFCLSICFRLKWFKPSLILNPLSYSNANYYSSYLVKRPRKLRSQEVIISTWQYHFDRQHVYLANNMDQTTKWSSFQHWVQPNFHYLTLKMASGLVVETSVANNSPSQDSSHPDDHFPLKSLVCSHLTTFGWFYCAHRRQATYPFPCNGLI